MENTLTLTANEITVSGHRLRSWPTSPQDILGFTTTTEEGDFINTSHGFLARTIKGAGHKATKPVKIHAISLWVCKTQSEPSLFTRLNLAFEVPKILIGEDHELFDPAMSDEEFSQKMNGKGSKNRIFRYEAHRAEPSQPIRTIYVVAAERTDPSVTVDGTHNAVAEPACELHTFRPEALYLQNVTQQKVLILSDVGVSLLQRSGLSKSELKLAWNRINSRKHERGVVFDTVHLVGPSGTEEIKLEGLSKSKAIELIRIIDSRMSSDRFPREKKDEEA